MNNSGGGQEGSWVGRTVGGEKKTAMCGVWLMIPFTLADEIRSIAILTWPAAMNIPHDCVREELSNLETMAASSSAAGTGRQRAT